MPGVEGDQVARAPVTGQQGAQAGRGEDPLDERLPQHGVVQPALVLDGQLRAGRGERGGEDALPAPVGRGAGLGVHGDSVQPATRAPGLEHVPVDVGQAGRAVGGEGGHRRGQVLARPAGDEPGPVRGALQAERLARGAEAELDLGADRHPVHVLCELRGQEPVTAVAAVEPHGSAEQAARHGHPGPDRFHRLHDQAAGRSRVDRRWRPRAVRALTVPSGTRRCSAISRCVRSP